MGLIRIVALGGTAAREGRRLIRRRALMFAVCVAGFTWLTAAAAFTLAEDVGEGGRLDSFVDALWWSAATITTVGYGDVTPVSVVGRTIGLVAMLVGISTFAVLTARAAAFLISDEDPSPADAAEGVIPGAVEVATADVVAGYGYLRLRQGESGTLTDRDWAVAFDPRLRSARDRYVLSGSTPSGA